jgi:HAD superfamily hydrolase (TIGR01458 family)
MNRRIAAALIDLSGTLHIEDTLIPGAVEALCRLQSADVLVKFVTNTTKLPLRLLHERLQSLGFDISRDEIFTSLTAARKVVERMNVRPFLILEDSAKEDFDGVDVTDPNAVVVGLAPSLSNYNVLNDAFRLLLDGAQLIAIHKGKYHRTKEGLFLGPGPFVAGLEYATGVQSQVVGKPEKMFFHEAVHLLGVEPSQTVMVGDDVRDDVLGALEAGLLGILVQTGKYRAGDENTISPVPTAVCSDFTAAVDFILANNSRVAAQQTVFTLTV